MKQFESFDYHVSIRHNIFKYLHYRIYLERKDRSDYDALEYYIRNQISESKLNWIPNDPNEYEKEKEQERLLQNVDDIKTTVDSMFEAMKKKFEEDENRRLEEEEKRKRADEELIRLKALENAQKKEAEEDKTKRT